MEVPSLNLLTIKRVMDLLSQEEILEVAKHATEKSNRKNLFEIKKSVNERKTLIELIEWREERIAKAEKVFQGEELEEIKRLILISKEDYDDEKCTTNVFFNYYSVDLRFGYFYLTYCKDGGEEDIAIFTIDTKEAIEDWYFSKGREKGFWEFKCTDDNQEWTVPLFIQKYAMFLSTFFHSEYFEMKDYALRNNE